MERISSKQDIKAAKNDEEMVINWAWKRSNEQIIAISKTVSLKYYI